MTLDQPQAPKPRSRRLYILWVIALTLLTVPAVLASGCAKSVTVESSRALGRPGYRFSGKKIGLDIPPLPAGHVIVKARVSGVRYPLLRSPSVGGDRASGTCRIESGAIPGREDATHIKLRFDPDPGGLMRGNWMRKGDLLQFTFTKEGKLFRWTSSRHILPHDLKGIAPPEQRKD